MLDYLFFFALESDQAGIIPAKQCWLLNTLLPLCTQESHQVQSTTQLSLVQHRERQEHPIPLPWLNFQTPHQLPNLPAAQRGRPQGEGVSSTGFHPSGREGSSKHWQHQGSCRSDWELSLALTCQENCSSPGAKQTQKRTELQRFTPAHYFSNPSLTS